MIDAEFPAASGCCCSNECLGSRFQFFIQVCSTSGFAAIHLAETHTQDYSASFL